MQVTYNKDSPLALDLTVAELKLIRKNTCRMRAPIMKNKIYTYLTCSDLRA